MNIVNKYQSICIIQLVLKLPKDVATVITFHFSQLLCFLPPHIELFNYYLRKSCCNTQVELLVDCSQLLNEKKQVMSVACLNVF